MANFAEYAIESAGVASAQTNADTFGYNDRSEVVFSHGATENTEYSYDGIGNLLANTCGGITNTFTANCLNQYTLCASASLREFSYDADGNLLSDGVFSFTYDAGNRLSSVSSNDTLLATFAYDAQGRRVRKETPAATHTYFYDGWNLIHEIIETTTALPNYPTTELFYHWGKDLSGSIGGAGGVGGLLYVSIANTNSNSNSNSSTPPLTNSQLFFPTYDVNGNITHYCDQQGNVVASYTYDAFGNTIAQAGSMADTFSHRFSTKYFDVETGLYYYGYRFYSPELMRWLNRDPIEEQGGENLYAFCKNNPIFAHDISGLKCTQISTPQIKPGSRWKVTRIKLKNANHNFMTMIYGVFSEWQIEGFVECCCKSPFFNKSSVITKNIKKKVSYMSEGYLTPIYPQTPELPIVVINPAATPIQPSPPTDLTDYLQDLIVGNIQEVFQELFLLAYIEKTDLELVKNAIESSKPSSYEEGEWPRNPCN